MDKQRLLLLSNSTNPGEAYLEYPMQDIKDFLENSSKTALFIPYAAVTFSYDTYESKVATRFEGLGCRITGIHRFHDPVEAVRNAEVIVVGGGNTWKLVKDLQDNHLLEEIRKKVKAGTPYIGWSAGSNIACPTLRTTNDMPIVQPVSFDTLNLIAFQINPHYTDAHPNGLGGETREDRINEFITVNPEVYVVGLREGTMLRCEGKSIRLIGNRTARIFKYDKEAVEWSAEGELPFSLSPQ